MQICGIFVVACAGFLYAYVAGMTHREADELSEFAWAQMSCHGNPGLTFSAVFGYRSQVSWGTGIVRGSPPSAMPMATDTLVNIGAMSYAFTGGNHSLD